MMLTEEAPLAAEVLPVATLRAYLRLGSGFQIAEDPAETTALAGFLRTAIAAIEARTGKVLLRRPFRLQIEDWRDPAGQPLPLAPVSALTQVQIMPGPAGPAADIPLASVRLIPDMQRPVLAPVGGLLAPVPSAGWVTIRFVAGFADRWEDVPADLAQAAIMLAARYFEDRGSDEAGRGALPFGVAALLERWRAVRTLAGRGARP